MNDELEGGLRMCLASLYERDPNIAALFLAFGPYSSGEITPFVITACRPKKLMRGFETFGQQSFECLIAFDNSSALETKYGVKAAVAMHWFLEGKPPFECVVSRILDKVRTEVPLYDHSPADIRDLILITEVLRFNGL